MRDPRQVLLLYFRTGQRMGRHRAVEWFLGRVLQNGKSDKNNRLGKSISAKKPHVEPKNVI